MVKAASAKAWKYIFEIRYPASARLFDKRGYLMEQFQSEPFTEWRVQRNRVDLYNKENSISVFASFKNAGAVAEDAPTFTYFRDHLQRWLRLIIPELKVGRIERIGFRTIYLAPFENLSFEQLFKSFTNSYLKVYNKSRGLTITKPTDVGIVVDFSVDGCKLHMVAGPMEQKQARNYFDCDIVKDKIPSLSIFVDLDYFIENPSFEENRTLQMIIKFVNDAQQRLQSHLEEFLQIFRQEE